MRPVTHAVADKALDTLRALYALIGAELVCEVGLDEVTRLYVVYGGKAKLLASVDDARMFLAQIGGAYA